MTHPRPSPPRPPHRNARGRPGPSRALLAALCLAAALPTASPLLAETRAPVSLAEVTLSFSPVVKAAAPAVVNIYATKEVAAARSPFAGDPFFERFFRGFATPQRRMQNSLGSGVIVSADGLVVSNNHVVGGADEIRVVLADKREYEAEILLADEAADLAVLRLKGASGLPALPLRDSDSIEVGDLVLAIGNPFGVGQTVTSGIVSGLARTGGAAGRGDGYFIQTDAPINPGNSGGALVDMKGALIGINASILSRSGGSNGIGFAIPANLVRQVVAQAQEGRTELARPWPGIEAQPVTGDLAEALGLDRPTGVLIREIHPASPLARAGLKRGDVLVSVAGHAVDSPQELDFRLAALGIGRQAETVYLREGRRREATVDLIAAPEDPPADIRRLDAGPLAGVTVGNLSPALAERVGAGLNQRGVVVIDADPRARRLGWRGGDRILSINGDETADTKALEKAAGRRAAQWEILIERDGKRGALRFRS